MPIALAPVSITAGTPITVSVGSAGTVGAVVIGNESPYAIKASAGSGGLWVLAQMADRLNCDSMAFNGAITLSASSYLTNATQAPSYQIYLTVYAPGELIPGTYPCALSRMFNVGNTVNTNAQTPNSLEQDLLTPCVLSGLTTAKDGTTASRLDVAGGVALLRQSDQSLGRVAPSATNFTTVQINSTYYLDLNPDGTWSWGTTHSGVTNYLAIAQVTTDASGNILAVTDARMTAATLFPGMAGPLTLPNLNNVSFTGYLNPPNDGMHGLNQDLLLVTNSSPLRYGIVIGDGSGWQMPFYKQSAGGGAKTKVAAISDSGGFPMIGGQATAGSLGAPVIVAQAVDVAVTVTTQVTILSYTAPATGYYRISAYLAVKGSGTPAVVLGVFYDDPLLGTGQNVYMIGNTPGGVKALTGVATNDSNQTVAPVIVKSAATHVINVFYQNNVATPNDLVTVFIERLS